MSADEDYEVEYFAGKIGLIVHQVREGSRDVSTLVTLKSLDL
ncbi:hypothetical protein [Mesorhizobium sp. J8]|nr:hypothetical protein [Mesorhizobium sp. J8]